MRTRKTSDITIAWPVRVALTLVMILDEDEELEDVPEDDVGAATGTRTVVEPKVWVDTAGFVADAEDPAAGDPDAEVGELGLATPTTNGLEEPPPVPGGRSKVVLPIVVCCKRFAEVS